MSKWRVKTVGGIWLNVPWTVYLDRDTLFLSYTPEPLNGMWDLPIELQVAAPDRDDPDPHLRRFSILAVDEDTALPTGMAYIGSGWYQRKSTAPGGCLYAETIRIHIFVKQEDTE